MTSSKDNTKSNAFWPEGWWKIMEKRIGIIPLPVYIILAGVIYYFCRTGKFPTEVSMMIAVMVFFGFTCSEVAKLIPGLKLIGAAAILATFIPSYLVYSHALPQEIVKSVTDFTKSTNFLYLFIASIIVGSIFGMDRRVLIQGFMKIFVPIIVGTILATIVGTLVGTALGLGAVHTLFYIVIPVMAGGVGEGAIPLSTGYADILHQPQTDQFSQVLPAVMFGSLMAILFSGTLNLIGKKYPSLTGNGKLQESGNEDFGNLHSEAAGTSDIGHIAAAGVTAITLYLVGTLTGKAFGWPAPVVMLFLAVLIKLSRAVSPQVQQGAFVVYRFFATAVTYPLLFAIGVSMTPWDKLIASFALPNLITIIATVATMTGTGFVVARWIKMYPIDTAIVTSCRCGQGGTGDVAILTASNRMELMPFAQVATRIGGGFTVLAALFAYRYFH